MHAHLVIIVSITHLSNNLPDAILHAWIDFYHHEVKDEQAQLMRLVPSHDCSTKAVNPDECFVCHNATHPIYQTHPTNPAAAAENAAAMQTFAAAGGAPNQ